MMSDDGIPLMDLVLEEIARDECLRLLRSQAIGRLAVADHGYYPPHIVPVNFVLEEDNVLFRSDAGVKFKLSILAEHSVSFEVDEIDQGGHMAWSVVVQGRAELVGEDEAEALEHVAWLHPLAPGDRPQLVRVVPYTITGRRLRPVPHVAGDGSH